MNLKDTNSKNRKMSKYYNDLLVAGSGSGYGGCYCPMKEGGLGGGAGGLGDLGLLAAGAAAVFLLYQAITMAMRKKREAGRFGSSYGSAVEDFLWTGRKSKIF